jgi:hypothetical protein
MRPLIQKTARSVNLRPSSQLRSATNTYRSSMVLTYVIAASKKSSNSPNSMRLC